MADPLSITCGVITLVTVAISSALTLSTEIRSFESHNKHTRALLGELGDLGAVLQSLLETIKSNPDIDFNALRSPLDRCGKACGEYGELIARFTKHSAGSRNSVRDWFKEKYLQGDVTDFRDMLAGYKSTISIAIANVNIRVAAITPRVLEDYKTMMSKTTQDLEEHLRDIDRKIRSLSCEEPKDCNPNSPEWQAILEEKEVTQQGLNFCAQLSSQIERLAPAVEADARALRASAVQEYVKNGVSVTKGSVQILASLLQNHDDMIERQLRNMPADAPMSSERSEELARLQATRDSIDDCIQVISKADEGTATIERQNVFEDITLADKSFSFTVSTVGDLVTARRIDLSGGSCNVGGQISDESFMKAVESLARGGNEVTWDTRKTATHPTRRGVEDNLGSDFQSRHGRGQKVLEVSVGAGKASRTRA